MGRCKGVWEGVITFRMCDSPKGGVKDVRKVYQLMDALFLNHFIYTGKLQFGPWPVLVVNQLFRYVILRYYNVIT